MSGVSQQTITINLKEVKEKVSTKSSRKIAEKAQRTVSAWQTLRPIKTYAGMTLAQYQGKVQPTLDSQQQVETLRDQLKQARDTRRQSESSSHGLTKLVVNSVKGDPDDGEDSPFYAALGYVQTSARQSGLTRKGQTTPTVVTNASETTTQTVAAK